MGRTTVGLSFLRFFFSILEFSCIDTLADELVLQEIPCLTSAAVLIHSLPIFITKVD